ncbi:sulfotransferase family protein [Petrachloros mirabilis]
MDASNTMENLIKQPIFIIGTGRCGSTIFHQILTEHPDVAWMSRISDWYPKNPGFNRLVMTAIDVPFVGNLIANKLWPVESYRFWDSYYRGFGTTCRDLFREDVTVKAKQEIRRVFWQMVTKKRARLLVKITGWPRIGFLKEIFPDAKFINVIRDGRAVAYSCISTQFWDGWRGPNNWLWGELGKKEYGEWEESGKSFIALAGIMWKTLMDATERAKDGLAAEDYLEIRYEDLCDDMEGVLRNVLGFVGMRWTNEFENKLHKYRLKNKDYKWRKDLTQSQQDTLQKVLWGHLTSYGYAEGKGQEAPQKLRQTLVK